MSMSPAYHLLGKTMQGESLNENQIKTIIGVIRKDERVKMLAKLQDYFELTQLAGDNGVEQNEEWDNGFQAAMALIKGKQIGTD